MSDTPIELKTLINKVSLGDQSAFSTLYDQTSAKLFAVCLRILVNKSDAEEALQEVYVKIWQKSNLYVQTHYQPMTWLITMARNHSIDKLRAMKPASSDIDEQVDVPSNAMTPEQELVKNSGYEQINKCIEGLKDTQAEAVKGSYLLGMTYQELADKHAVPINTMRTWLRRSLLLLRECLTS